MTAPLVHVIQTRSSSSPVSSRMKGREGGDEPFRIPPALLGDRRI